MHHLHTQPCAHTQIEAKYLHTPGPLRCVLTKQRVKCVVCKIKAEIRFSVENATNQRSSLKASHIHIDNWRETDFFGNGSQGVTIIVFAMISVEVVLRSLCRRQEPCKKHKQNSCHAQVTFTSAGAGTPLASLHDANNGR